MRLAECFIDIPTRAIDVAYSYVVPEHLAPVARPGCAVLVDFASRSALAYIMRVCDVATTPNASNSKQDLDSDSAKDSHSDFGKTLNPDKLKAIKDVLSEPFFDQARAQLAFWLAREYVSAPAEAVRLLTPAGATIRMQKDQDGTWQLKRLGATAIDERWVGLASAADDFKPRSNAVKQLAIISALRGVQMRVQDLRLQVDSPDNALKTLQEKGVVYIEARRRMRGPGSQGASDVAREQLTAGQRDALLAILHALQQAKDNAARRHQSGGSLADAGGASLACTPASDALADGASLACALANGTSSCAASSSPVPILLDGVTGSGKTEVYLQAIAAALQDGGGAIALVPEISLTPQTVARFRARFGALVAVLHSRLSAGERYDQWDLLKSGKARVAVGARSALFAPVKDLRIIIIDEEHDSSYKQGSAPRYVTRDVAAKLAELTGAILIMGSATPSMEVLHAAQSGKVMRLELPERTTGKALPAIQIVDLSVQFKSGNKSMFSLPLREALIKTMERKEKAVVLLNKRGFAAFLLCRDCGYVPTCENCATSFTYHTQPPALLCHHCGAQMPVPLTCPDCGSVAIKQLGPGTQFAYQQMQAFLPKGTPIVRMDADTTKLKGGHEQCLNEFIACEYGVLVGTQMIAKGLDFPDVTLVGVLIADTGLKFPDFRAPERTYQLLEQVAGRAGRSEKDGRVIVQTYWPEHLAIRAAATHQRELLFADERAVRQQTGYPPYVRLANIILKGNDFGAVSASAMALANLLESQTAQIEGFEVLGPSPCVISKRQGAFRWHVLIKANPACDIAGLIAPTIRGFKAAKGVALAVDIDPYDML